MRSRIDKAIVMPVPRTIMIDLRSMKASVLASLLLLSYTGCDFQAFAVKATARTTARASIALESHWDYELATSTMPGSIIQFEGMLTIVPEDEVILLTLVRAYVGYTYAVVEDHAEIAEAQGDYETAQYHRDRSRYLYQRAKDLGMYLLSLKKDGMKESMAGGVEGFEEWLEKNFKKKEDAEILLWTGYAWGNWINASKDNMAAVADLPYVYAIVDHSRKLDETYFNGAAYMMLAMITVNGMNPDLDLAEKYFRRSIEIANGGSFLTIVNMGRFYATKRNDRELFIELMRQVLEADDGIPSARFTNMVAKRRAARYLMQLDELFLPEIEDDFGGEDEWNAEQSADTPSEGDEPNDEESE